MARRRDPEREAGKVQAAMAGMVEGLRRAMKQTLDADGSRWQGSLTASISGPLVLGPGKSVDAKLATRSAMLRRSFGWAVSGVEQLHGMKAQKFSTSGYSLIHELGGIIRPRNARYLAIPLPPAMTPSGVQRQPPRAYGRQLFVLRIHGKYFLARRPPRAPKRESFESAHAGVLGLPQPKKRRRKPPKLELLYVLKDRVIITPRLQMREFHEKDTAARAADLERFFGMQMQKLAAKAAP